MSQFHTSLDVMVIKIRKFLALGRGTLCGYHQVVCSVFGGRGFDTRGCCLLGLSGDQLRGG